jgi:hypothetical protein
VRVTHAIDIQAMYDKMMKDEAFFNRWLRSEATQREWLREAIAREIQSKSYLTGANRTVIVMRSDDYQRLWPPGQATGVEAVTVSDKVIFAPDNADLTTIAHELVHATPTPGGSDTRWTSPGMVQECGQDYHNKVVLWAHGVRLMRGRAPARERVIQRLPLMGPGDPTNPEITSDSYWITQCTYWHLLNVLPNLPDPPVMLIQGVLARDDTDTGGMLLPAYQFMSQVDLTAGSTGDYAIVPRDEAGAELGRFAYSPDWDLPDRPDGDRSLFAFAYRIPDLPGAARIDLEGPNGLLQSRTLSAAPPSVAITTPADGAAVDASGGAVHVEWSATGAEGDDLLAGVLYSRDGGATWLDQAFEITGTSLDVAEAAPDDPAPTLKVIVTNGTRSAEATVRFTITAPPTGGGALTP